MRGLWDRRVDVRTSFLSTLIQSYTTYGLTHALQDNQPRTLPEANVWTDHSFTAWVDATAHAVISARLLVRMADELDQTHRPEVEECRREASHLAAYMHE